MRELVAPADTSADPISGYAGVSVGLPAPSLPGHPSRPPTVAGTDRGVTAQTGLEVATRPTPDDRWGRRRAGERRSGSDVCLPPVGSACHVGYNEMSSFRSPHHYRRIWTEMAGTTEYTRESDQISTSRHLVKHRTEEIMVSFYIFYD